MSLPSTGPRPRSPHPVASEGQDPPHSPPRLWVLRTGGREAKWVPGLGQKADLGWESSLAISCGVTLGVGLTLSEPQFPARIMEIRIFRRGRWDDVGARGPDRAFPGLMGWRPGNPKAEPGLSLARVQAHPRDPRRETSPGCVFEPTISG